MIRTIVVRMFVLTIALSGFAQSGPTVVAGDTNLKKVLPDSYFFRGMTATTQLRNSAAVHFPDDAYVIVGLVDTSGYSTDIKEKYIGLLITEKKLQFDGGSVLGPGEYGMGYAADNKFHILNVAGDEVLVTDIMVDDSLKRPQPLKMVVDGQTVKLYLGKKYVSFSAVQ